LVDTEVPPTLLRYFEEGIAAHFHDPWEGLSHELKEFSDDGLQKVPVGFEESRVLPHDVHYIGGDYCFVVFAFLLLTEVEKGLL
jgi:hypothetical protein